MNLLNVQGDLMKLIEHKRKEMITTASMTGLSSHQTLRTSIELDVLLNLHHEYVVLANKTYAS